MFKSLASQRSQNQNSASVLKHEDLTRKQQDVFARIVKHIRTLSTAEIEFEANRSSDDYRNQQALRRPRHVCFIDGSRGSGKTSVMLTIREYVQFLGRKNAFNLVSSSLPRDGIERVFKDVVKKLGTQDGDSDFLDPHVVAGTSGHPQVVRHTALVLPVLFPSDLENAQPIMEGLFSLLAERLEEWIKANKSESGHPEGGRRQKQANKLLDQIYRTVAKGWFQSQREGLDAILAEAFSYDDFIERRGKASGGSYRRVREWRDFINNYLNFFEAQTLVVSVDDTDVNPDVSADILHTIRIFLDHPRIVTLIAGNLRAMRQSLLQRQLAGMRQSVGALASPEGQTAVEWRRFLRQQTEEYLDKILPRAIRFYISLTPDQHYNEELAEPGDQGLSNDQKRVARALATDFGRVSSHHLKTPLSFDDYCKHCLRANIGDFLALKLDAHRKWGARQSERRSREDEFKLEYQISWWLMRHWYGDKLQPRTFRELRTLLELTAPESIRADSAAQPNSASEAVPASKCDKDRIASKRLPVVLFDSPLNYELSHRLSDSDANIMSWLRTQDIESFWHGSRYFRINDREVSEGGYSFEFLCFRMDLAIAMPLHDNPDGWIPQNFLPKPSGRNILGRLPFYSSAPLQPPMVVGLARRIAHSLIPANCIYFHDLECLPDLAFEPSADNGPWTSNAIYDWHELFQPRAAIRREGEPPINERHQEAVEAYVRDVVLPLASFEFGRFIADPKDDMHKGVGANLLKDELQQQFYSKDREFFDGLRRRVDYLNWGVKAGHIDAREMGTFKEPINKGVETLFDRAFPEKPNFASPPARSFISYQWLLNDLRRAWHATRIAENQFSEIIDHAARTSLDTSLEHRPQSPRRSFERSDRYRVDTIPQVLTSYLKYNSTRQREWDLATGKICNDDSITSWDDLGFSLLVNSISVHHQETGGASVQSVWDGLSTSQLTPRHGNSILLFGTDEESLTTARIYRTLFLYVLGIGPCLPTLIHIDFAGSHYGEKFLGLDPGTCSRDRFERYKDWDHIVTGLQRFVVRFRATMEAHFVLLECLEPMGGPDLKPGVQKCPAEKAGLLKSEADCDAIRKLFERSLFSDACIGTLGLTGREGLAKKFGSEAPTEFADDIVKLLTEDPKRGRVSNVSLFADAERYLKDAKSYLDIVKGNFEHAAQAEGNDRSSAVSAPGSSPPEDGRRPGPARKRGAKRVK